MRLTSLYIGQYKNLRDFSLSFDGGSFIDVFVGKNGTGKSNLFEALIEIFRHLDGSRKTLATCDFNYRIGFEIDGKKIEIGWNSGTLTIDGKERKTIGKTPLPDNVLIYYSGHNDTVAKLVEQYEEAFRQRIKRKQDCGVGPRKVVDLPAIIRKRKPSAPLIARFSRQKRRVLQGIKRRGSSLSRTSRRGNL
ncbi:AAA family ATPase [Geoalkalibacter halelectricus]|uniref:Endonuclease GajA/Old nuclease/RecF-like AAA domain-containing protein n=1 Tax=Geoalkalibacter halelectricus TaxID=2847045 RepID=A0ABY5ZJI6_9BACT|nr:hypothetical protein [Geoalkalibacter halelectricus]MDO3379349.1 hypothetical protein [Geoalkalibacter halelectricus]UWZ78773.1 hypothetical protein L9S41_13945 [Geoalkalibacter halelectricus]